MPFCHRGQQAVTTSPGDPEWEHVLRQSTLPRACPSTFGSCRISKYMTHSCSCSALSRDIILYPLSLVPAEVIYKHWMSFPRNSPSASFNRACLAARHQPRCHTSLSYGNWKQSLCVIKLCNYGCWCYNPWCKLWSLGDVKVYLNFSALCWNQQGHDPQEIQHCIFDTWMLILLHPAALEMWLWIS